MKLIHIKESVCKTCGAIIVAERTNHLHTNNLWNEYREFSCGRVLHFCPNFCKVIVEEECTKSKLFKTKIKKREKLKEQIFDLVENSNVDKKYKDAITSRLEYI